MCSTLPSAKGYSVLPLVHTSIFSRELTHSKVLYSVDLLSTTFSFEICELEFSEICGCEKSKFNSEKLVFRFKNVNTLPRFGCVVSFVRNNHLVVLD